MKIPNSKLLVLLGLVCTILLLLNLVYLIKFQYPVKVSPSKPLSIINQPLRLAKLMQALELTPEQNRQLLDLNRQFQQKIDQLQQNRLQKTACLCCLFSKTKWDETKLQQIVRSMNEAELQYQNELVHYFNNLSGILNDAQRKRFFDSTADELCQQCQCTECKSSECICEDYFHQVKNKK